MDDLQCNLYGTTWVEHHRKRAGRETSQLKVEKMYNKEYEVE